MTTCVIGSLREYDRIKDIGESLKEMGHKVLLPLDMSGAHFADRFQTKNKFIRGMYDQIKQCDSVLVVNDLERDGMKGYIGPNTFLQMGMALSLGKSIYALAKWDERLPYNEELQAMDVKMLDLQRRF